MFQFTHSRDGGDCLGSGWGTCGGGDQAVRRVQAWQMSVEGVEGLCLCLCGTVRVRDLDFGSPVHVHVQYARWYLGYCYFNMAGAGRCK
jgi:hypothetical protein